MYEPCVCMQTCILWCGCIKDSTSHQKSSVLRRARLMEACTVQSDSSCPPLLEARRKSNKHIPAQFSHPFCTRCVIPEYFGHSHPNHPQPSSLSSHVRGNCPNRQTGKSQFRSSAKVCPRTGEKILWIDTQLFLAPEHS